MLQLEPTLVIAILKGRGGSRGEGKGGVGGFNAAQWNTKDIWFLQITSTAFVLQFSDI